MAHKNPRGVGGQMPGGQQHGRGNTGVPVGVAGGPTAASLPWQEGPPGECGAKLAYAVRGAPGRTQE